MRTLIVLCSAVLAATAAPASAQPAAAWEIGPIIRGKNYSVGMPLQPTPAARGWSFAFPQPDVGAGHVHYLTFRHGSLAGASRLVLRYRIDASPRTRFVPREHPDQAATVSLFFQRQGDSWSGKRHEHHRWYAPARTMRALTRGEYEVSVELDDPDWISVFGKTASANPAAFATALAQTERVGFVFGSGWARGHGVYATGPARFTLVSFRVL